MVKIRLRRKGRSHYPIYDIVAVDGRQKRDGAYLERLGYYDPHTKPSTIKVDPDRAVYWLNIGAQPTDMVRELLSYEGILLRRHLQFKGKTEFEIQEAVKEHKKIAIERYFRRAELRKKRIETREKEKQQQQSEEQTAQ
jgi:small subunit ribosomal protein S16